MNTAAVILVSVVLSAAAATGVSFALRPAESAPDTAIPDLQRAIADLRTANAALQKKVDESSRAPTPVSAPASAERSEAVVPQEQIKAAVDAYMKNLQPLALPANGTSPAAATFDLDKELALLSGTYYDENPALWKRLHESGKAKEAIDRLEAAVKANPKDVKAQMDLANACLSCMRSDPANYGLAVRADKAFDDVLAVDDQNWEARFTKAVSYSFWPPITGKPKQAIAHLEKLVTQQDSMPPNARDADTYLILGNLLEQSDPARAKEIWKKGAKRHPNNTKLAERLAQ